MRFSTKLIIYSIVPAVVLATAALIGVAGNLGAEQRFSRFFESQQAQAGAVNEMYTQGLQMAQAVRNIVLDPTNKRAFDNLAAATREYDAAAVIATKLAPRREDADVLAAIAGFRERQRAAAQQVIELVKTDNSAAVAYLNKKDTPA